jgi:hypothetical protein
MHSVCHRGSRSSSCALAGCGLPATPNTTGNCLSVCLPKHPQIGPTTSCVHIVQPSCGRQGRPGPCIAGGRTRVGIPVLAPGMRRDRQTDTGMLSSVCALAGHRRPRQTDRPGPHAADGRQGRGDQSRCGRAWLLRRPPMPRCVGQSSPKGLGMPFGGRRCSGGPPDARRGQSMGLQMSRGTRHSRHRRELRWTLGSDCPVARAKLERMHPYECRHEPRRIKVCS